MLTKEELLKDSEPLPPIEVEVPAWNNSVFLRHPTFKEWHGIVSEMKKSGEGGKDPSAELVARTIAVCLSDADGKRLLSDFESQKLLNKDIAPVMFLYQECWRTVLSSHNKIEEAEKNC